MSLNIPWIARLFRHACTGAAIGPGPEGEAPDDERQLRWALEGGLGAWLHRAVSASNPQAWSARWRAEFHAADLTARVHHAQRQATADTVLDACHRMGIRAVLLKGISVSGQYYPEPHLRPMGDVDVLVCPEHQLALEAELRRTGFEPMPFDMPAGFHHGAPLCDPATGTYVELHRAVFSADSPLAAGTLFAPEVLRARSVPIPGRHPPARRLVPELQLCYIAASWLNDIMQTRLRPQFTLSLLDALLLIARDGPTLDWSGLIDTLDNDLAAAALHVLLGYVPRFGIVLPADDGLRRLGQRQHLVGPLQRRWMHGVFDRYLIGGREWDRPYPPPVPGRYSVRWQWRKRVASRWGAAPARAAGTPD